MSLTPEQLAYMEKHINDNKAVDIIVANIICAIAAYIAVGLRFWARHLARVHYGGDDWWIVGALVIALPS